MEEPGVTSQCTGKPQIHSQISVFLGVDGKACKGALGKLEDSTECR